CAPRWPGTSRRRPRTPGALHPTRPPRSVAALPGDPRSSYRTSIAETPHRALRSIGTDRTSRSSVSIGRSFPHMTNVKVGRAYHPGPAKEYAGSMDRDERAGLEGEIRRCAQARDFAAAANAAIRGYGREIYELLAALHRRDDDAAEVFSLFTEGLWR